MPAASATDVAATDEPPPSTVTVPTERLPKQIIHKQVRNNIGRARLCYERALQKDPNLKGRVIVNFTIKPDGSVGNVRAESTDLIDAAMLQCIEKAFYGLSFPAPEGGKVTVKYPIELHPGS